MTVEIFNPGIARAAVLDECPPAKRLYIAVPAYTGDVSVETAQALLGAVAPLQALGISASVAFQQGCCYLDHARNILANAFMASDATDVLFVDADVGFDPAAVVQIAQATRPFIAGVYPKKNDDPAWPVQFDADELSSDADGLVEAASVATGFLRINRSVFDALPVPEYEDDSENRYRAYFTCGVRAGRYRGEDADLCHRWKVAGGKIYILPELVFTHTGPKAWRGSWGEWMRRRLDIKEAAE